MEVEGEFGTTPQVTFDAPLEISAPYTEEIISGDGVELRDDAALMLSYLAIDAVTGETIRENYQAPPEIMLLGEDTGVLHEELLGRQEGSRLLRVELGIRDRPNPAVLVYDIRHTQAWGDPVDPPDDAPEETPQISVDDDGVPVIEVPDGDPPADLQVVPVLRGDGPQVRAGQSVTVRYSTVSWSTGEVTDTLWGEGMLPTTIPFTGLIPAWQNGLVDEQVGSRVMLITPPELAYGTDTLVFVIDVLAVSTQEDNGVDDDGGQEDSGNNAGSDVLDEPEDDGNEPEDTPDDEDATDGEDEESIG